MLVNNLFEGDIFRKLLFIVVTIQITIMTIPIEFYWSCYKFMKTTCDKGS